MVARVSVMEHLVVVGCGNTGSQAIGHLARMPSVTHLTVIDPDRYEQRNLAGQNIVARDLLKSKAAVQARHALRIRPELHVDVIKHRVEEVPLGLLRSRAILSCVDNARARQWI